MKVYLATDHGGFEYKEKIKKWLKNEYEVEDVGNLKFDPDDDYTEFVIPLAEKVSADWKDGKRDSFGIILGRSGNGELIAANKVKGARAVMGCNPKMAEISRQHNDANIISFGADHMDLEVIKEAITKFLSTDFLNKQRYIRRIKAHEAYMDLHNKD